jgi:hypothetical protein
MSPTRDVPVLRWVLTPQLREWNGLHEHLEPRRACEVDFTSHRRARLDANVPSTELDRDDLDAARDSQSWAMSVLFTVHVEEVALFHLTLLQVVFNSNPVPLVPT